MKTRKIKTKIDNSVFQKEACELKELQERKRLVDKAYYELQDSIAYNETFIPQFEEMEDARRELEKAIADLKGRLSVS